MEASTVAREQDRLSDGRFGHRSRAEADVDLVPDDVGSPGLAVAARAVVDRFERRSMSCTKESKRLVAALRRAGVQAEHLSLVEEQRGPHAVVVVGAHPAPGEQDSRIVIDLTFDQFDPSAPVPLIRPLSEYVVDWDDYGTDFFAGSVLSSWRPAAVEPPIHAQRSEAPPRT